MHNGLAGLLAEGILKVGAIVLAKVVSRNRLTTVLVNALEDLVASGVSQTREQGDKLPADGCAGLVLEDDLVQLASTGDLEAWQVNGLFSRVDSEFEVCSLHETGCSSIASQWYRPLLVLAGVTWHRRELSAAWISGGGMHTGWKMASSAIPAEPAQDLSVEVYPRIEQHRGNWK